MQWGFVALLWSYFDCGALVFCGHRRLCDLFVYLIPVVLHVPHRVHTQRAAICSKTNRDLLTPLQVSHQIYHIINFVKH